MANDEYIGSVLRRLAASLAIMAVAVAAQAQIMREPDPPEVGIDQQLGTQLNLDLTFKDESGEDVRLGDLFRGKPVVITLVYYDCPMLCGEVMQGMLACFNDLDFTLGEEYDAIIVSIDPSEGHELAAMKKQNVLEGYERGGGEDGWRFLTAPDESQVKELAASIGFRYQYMPSVAQYAHGSGIMVVTPAGKVSRYFYGVSYEPQDVTFGLMDAAGGKIGTLADKALLLCYMYDPNSGSYALTIMNILRIAGVLTVLAIGSGVGGFLMWERRKIRTNAGSAEHLAHS